MKRVIDMIDGRLNTLYDLDESELSKTEVIQIRAKREELVCLKTTLQLMLEKELKEENK